MEPNTCVTGGSPVELSRFTCMCKLPLCRTLLNQTYKYDCVGTNLQNGKTFSFIKKREWEVYRTAVGMKN